MSDSSYFEPRWVSPPGDTISDLIRLKGVDLADVADMAGEPVDVLEDLLRGRTKLTRALARALTDTIGGSVDFWLNRERQYREDVSRHHLLQDASEIHWISEIPVTELMNLGWLPRVAPRDRLKAVLNFFGVKDMQSWRERYAGMASAVSFRTSPVFASDLGAVLAWLRMGEVAALGQTDRPLAPNKLLDLLPNMRALTRLKQPKDFLPSLRRLCNSAGVALVVAAAPKGCKASGGTWITDNRQAICLISHRYRTDDQFWFTFFHEMGHLCLHSDRSLFLEDGDELRDEDEDAANSFAQDVLIPEAERRELEDLPRAHRPVVRFAMRSGVAAGIVVGQMQHMGLLPVNWLNSLKRRLDWTSTL